MIGLARPVTHRARAVVTGAGSGIGRSFAVQLGARGAAVVCADIDAASAKETSGLVERHL
jgi:NAD(P)-dependent dehydrogenase (short-subunit alcohol dehydrogenase family)